MALRVIEDASNFSEDLTSGIVVVESDLERGGLAIEELAGHNARHKALGYANSKGIADARINGTPTGAYPLNSEGQSLDEVKDENGESRPPQHPDMQVVAYRIDIPVVRKLV
jgi:hypothetical protein